MANANPKKLDAQFTMRADQEFYDLLDVIRSERRPIPTRAEIVREAVAALASRSKKKGRA